MNNLFHNKEYQAEIQRLMNQMISLRYGDPKSAYLEIRRCITQIIKSENFTSKIKCGSASNCSFCCHSPIEMGKAEADYIKQVILDKKVIPNKDRIKAQNQNQKPKWMDKACPMLLDENEKGQRLCSIYENRPLICMTHNSTEDPNKCNKENDPKRVIQQAQAAMIDAFSLTSFALGANNNRDVPKHLVKLHEMLNEMEF